MRCVAWLLSTLIVVGASACGTSASPNDRSVGPNTPSVGPNAPSVSPNLVQVTGTVRHYALEGGFWAIRGDDSTTYDPVGALPAGFQQDGLRVKLQAKVRTDLASFHMIGPIVEIVSIERL